jgi:hypothetical protein
MGALNFTTGSILVVVVVRNAGGVPLGRARISELSNRTADEGLGFREVAMFDDSSYQDTLREHERSHHPVGGGFLLVLVVALVVGFCLLLI